MILEGYDRFGAVEKISGALKNILDYYGVVAPHTGEPFTETMLMGIGGGARPRIPYLHLEVKILPSREEGANLLLPSVLVHKQSFSQ